MQIAFARGLTIPCGATIGACAECEDFVYRGSLDVNGECLRVLSKLSALKPGKGACCLGIWEMTKMPGMALLTALSSPNINNFIFYLPWVTTNCDREGHT